MAPLGSQPGIVEIQPADHGSNIECRLHWIKLVICAGNPCAIGNYCAGDDGAQQLGTCRVFERFQPAAQGIDEAGTRCCVGQLALDLEVKRIVGNVVMTLSADGRSLLICEGT